MYRVCYKCGRELTIDSFHNDNTRKRNKRHICRECQAKIYSDWYSKNKKARCNKCGKVKTIRTQFYQTRGGYFPICKVCENKHNPGKKHNQDRYHYDMYFKSHT